MFKLIPFFTLAAILSFIEAKKCSNISIPVTLHARNGVFNVPDLSDQTAVTKFVQDLFRNGQNYSASILSGYTTITDQYNIGATVCVPSTPSNNSDSWQFLTHGIGYDRSYWDLPYNNHNYSYIDVAVDTYGYSTLSIDRLGTGSSSHPDPISIVQAPAHLSTLIEVTTLLRSASLPNLTIPIPKSIIHVGHSFGSILTYELASRSPNSTDGIILQGFSVDNAFQAENIAGFNTESAFANQPYRFVGLSPGYFTWASLSSNQFSFLAPPYYDVLLAQETELTKETFTAGEMLTLGALPTSAPGFTGPVLVLTGEEDMIFCGGNCSASAATSQMGNSSTSNIPAAAVALFPMAKSFRAYIQPRTGHAVNVHYNATGAYDVMNLFLKEQGF